jgi:hypothetical protein
MPPKTFSVSLQLKYVAVVNSQLKLTRCPHSLAFTLAKLPTSKTVKTRNKHRGSSFEDFLKQEGLLENVQAAAFKRALALKVNDMMKDKRMNKSATADTHANVAAAVHIA